MKKFITFLILLLFVLVVPTTFASETAGDDVIYIDSFEQYKELLQSVDDMEEAKLGYIEATLYAILYDSQMPAYKAKVTSASEVETVYGTDETGAYYLQVYQVIDLKVLDGEYAGQTFENCMYPIKVDTFMNIDVPEIKMGDTIYVSVYSDGENLYPGIRYLDSVINRWPVVLGLAIITIAFLLIYTGKHGAKLLIPAVLVLDLLFIVFADFIINYFGVWVVVSTIILLSAIAIFALKVGVNGKLINAIISLAAILVVMALAIYGFDYLAKIGGVSYESASLAEDIYPALENMELVPTVDFHALSIGVTILMIAFAIIPMIAKTIEMLENDTEETREELKKYLAEKIMFVTGILLVATIQKYMVVYLNVSRFVQVLNSEMLIIEFSRIMFVIIAMSLSTTITEMVTKALDDK